MTDLSAVRKRAWETRREKYGPRGHCGSYAASGRCGACQSMTDMIVRLHVEGVLSEGQASKATGLDRVALRIKADAFNPLQRSSGGSEAEFRFEKYGAQQGESMT
jgi:hypothetical protein